MISIEQLNAKLKATKEQREQIFEQITPLQEKAVLLYNEIKEINEAITKETLKTVQSEQDRFDFLLAETGFGSDMVRYNAADAFIRSMGLYMSSYCPFSQQRTSEVFIFKKNDEGNLQSIESLKKLITLYKPMDEEGNKLFRVCCTNYTVAAHQDGTFSLQSRYSTTTFETLELLFAHYVKHCKCYDDDDSEEGDD